MVVNVVVLLLLLVRVSVLVFVSVLALVRGAAAGGLARVQGAGVLRWGGDQQGGEPYVYADPQRPGQLTGFEVEIAAAVARELGVRAEFVQNDWSTLIPSLERGTF